MLAADYASVVRIEADGLRILSLSPDAGHSGELLRDTDTTASALVAQSGTAQLTENETNETTVGTLAHLALRSTAAAPIRIGQKLWGTIGVGIRSTFVDKYATIELLRAFADQVSVAISDDEAWNERDRQAHRDSVTSLRNRRVFEGLLERECERAARTNVPLAVVMIDLDHFKEI